MKPIIILLVAVLSFTSCTNYGKKVKSSNIEVYYKDGITETQAQKTADYIYSIDTNPETKDNKKSFQLTAIGDTIECKMVVNEEKYKDINIVSFERIGSGISENVFDGKPVNLVLSTNRFKPLQTVYFKKNEENDNLTKYGERITSGNVELFVTGGASMEDGNKLVQLLDKEMNPSTIISFQLTKDPDGMNMVRMVSSEEKVATLSDQTITDMAAQISDGVFNGSPIIFEFTDTQFNSIKTFTYDPE
jgi:hypothetical protein